MKVRKKKKLRLQSWGVIYNKKKIKLKIKLNWIRLEDCRFEF